LSNPTEPGADGLSPKQRDHPLDLAVHSQPLAVPLAGDADARTLWGRIKMFIILLVCAAPVVASYLTYYVIRPDSRRSYGELIEPQRPLPPIRVGLLDGREIALPSLKGQWLLLSAAPGACDQRCQRHLYLQRQLRESLGKDKARLDWVWVVTDAAQPDAALQTALKAATVLRMDAAQVTSWLPAEPGRLPEDHLYLVDPMGNLMMRFPAGVNVEAAGKAKRDIERLMRASSSWDLPGR
jgi:hypothetical protein